jgi:hypothetical protein
MSISIYCSYKSFSRSADNIGDITAKGEAQLAVVDLLGRFCMCCECACVYMCECRFGFMYRCLGMRMCAHVHVFLNAKRTRFNADCLIFCVIF